MARYASLVRLMGPQWSLAAVSGDFLSFFFFFLFSFPFFSFRFSVFSFSFYYFLLWRDVK